MNPRVRQSDLEQQLVVLNRITNSPMLPYDKESKVWQGGNYHLSYAYGGVCVHQICRTGSSAVKEPIFHGHRPKREAYSLIEAYINGVSDNQTLAERNTDS